MTFDEIAKAIGEGLGMYLAVVDDATAVRLSSDSSGETPLPPVTFR